MALRARDQAFAYTHNLKIVFINIFVIDLHDRSLIYNILKYDTLSQTNLIGNEFRNIF